MGRFLLLAAVLTMVFTADCGGPPCYSLEEVDAVLPAQGAWDLTLEQPQLSGECSGIDTQALVAARLRAELGVLDGSFVHMDIEGLHVEAQMQGDHLYGEGWSDAGFMYGIEQAGSAGDDAGGDAADAPVRLPLGVVLDAWLDTPRSMDGELFLVIEHQRGACEAAAWFHGELVEGSEDEPMLCDERVPLDDHAPVRHPDAYEADAWCD